MLSDLLENVSTDSTVGNGAGGAADPPVDPPIVREEKQLLEVVLAQAGRRGRHQEASRVPVDDASALIELRDALAEAKPEDQGSILEQMHRIEALSRQRGKGDSPPVDRKSPYFGHMRLEEGGKRRDVLDRCSAASSSRAAACRSSTGATPPSRACSIATKKGTVTRSSWATAWWRGRCSPAARWPSSTPSCAGWPRPRGPTRATCAPAPGARSPPASREAPDRPRRQRTVSSADAPARAVPRRPARRPHPRQAGPGRRAAGRRPDRHLPAIAALIDPRQFELITQPSSGLIAVQGSAGSGKTTIGLHRIAYLAFADPRRFRPERMLVVVYQRALATYVSRVLPSLDVPGVPVMTFAGWAEPRAHGGVPQPGRRAHR